MNNPNNYPLTHGWSEAAGNNSLCLRIQHSLNSVVVWRNGKSIRLMNTWITHRRGFEPPWCQICVTLLVPLSKVLHSNCSVVRSSHKAVSPVYMYLNINTSVHVKNVTGYSKRAGDHPRTVDCTSKLHSSTLGSRVWGKGDCGPFESPLCRSTYTYIHTTGI